LILVTTTGTERWAQSPERLGFLACDVPAPAPPGTPSGPKPLSSATRKRQPPSPPATTGPSRPPAASASNSPKYSRTGVSTTSGPSAGHTAGRVPCRDAALLHGHDRYGYPASDHYGLTVDFWVPPVLAPEPAGLRSEDDMLQKALKLATEVNAEDPAPAIV
jgi:hypothetical protein